MNKEELLKLIDHEISWLKYYGLREDRIKLTEESDIYKDVRSIGYTKRVIDLDKRCCPCLIIAGESIEDCVITQFPRGEGKLSLLEVYKILYKEEYKEILKDIIRC